MATVEERLTTLENAVTAIERCLAARPVEPNWLDRFIGSVRDKEAFEEALEYGRQFRYSDRPKDDDEPAP
jgi:hypothetical protein